MEDIIVNLNKEHAIKQISNQLELFSKEIIKKNFKIKELKEELRKTEKGRVQFARAYCKEIGIILNKKGAKKMRLEKRRRERKSTNLKEYT